MVRKRTSVDDFVEEYGLKHGACFEDYTPGEDGVSLEVKDYHTDDSNFSDIFAMAEKYGLVIWVEKIRVFVKIPEED